MLCIRSVFTSLFGAHGLHHSGGAVGSADGDTVGIADAGIGGEDMGPAVLSAEDGPFGEHRQTAEGSWHGRAGHGVRQDLIVEGDVDAVMIAVECHGLHIDVGVKEFGAADPGTGGRIQHLLGAMG